MRHLRAGRWLGKGVICVAFLATGIANARAGLINVVGDTGDGGVDVNGTPVNLSDPDFRPGTGGNIIRGQAAIYFFKLPIVPSVSATTSVALQIQYLGIYVDSVPSIPEFNLDLFGIGARPNADIQSSDYFAGSAASSSDELIQDDFITPSTVAGSLDVTNSNLFSFVTSLYNPDGTPIADFAVFRINPDAPLPPNSPPRRGYLVAMADNPDAAFRPQLVLAVNGLPEPSSFVVYVILIGALCTGYFRR